MAPSTEAQRDFGHDPTRLGEFRARYRVELAASDTTGILAERLARRPVVMLLHVTHDPNIDRAVMLQEVLNDPQVTSRGEERVS